MEQVDTNLGGVKISARGRADYSEGEKMQTRIKAWEVADGRLIALQDQTIAFTESELERWLFDSGDIFGEDLLVLCRQLKMPDGGRLDLLCMDASGRLVILELKRDMGNREALAQAIDYASWIDASSTEEVRARSKENIDNLETAFEQKFDAKLPQEWTCERPRLVLVAVGIDEAAERMIEFLAGRYNVDISAVMFNHARTSDGRQFLFRSVLAAPPVIEPQTSTSWRAVDLLAVADQRKTRQLVDLCRKISDLWWEESADTSGGSFRYWAKLQSGGYRMVFGVNVSGGLAHPEFGHPEPGQLDVWIKADRLAQVTGETEESIKDTLAAVSPHPPFRAGFMSFVIRLKTVGEAQALIDKLRGLSPPKSKLN